MYGKRFYVKEIMRKGIVTGYGVYDCIGGLESQHWAFMIDEGQTHEVAIHLANSWRDDANKGEQK